MRVKQLFFIVATLVCAVPQAEAQQAQSVCRMNIDEMFALADANSSSIKSLLFAEGEAAEALREAKNGRLPSIDFSASVSYLGDGWMSDRNFGGGMNAPMPHFGNNFAVEAAQVVYAGGAISSGITMAQLRQRMAQLETERNRQEIRFLLVGSYLELYKLNNEAAVYRKNIEQTERLLEDIRAKHREGLVIKNDITRNELRLKSLQLALTQIENSATIVNNRLVTTLHLPAETRIEPDSTILSTLPSAGGEARWQQLAEEMSPEMKQMEVAVEQAEQGIRLARANRIPAISLFAGDHLDGPVTIEVPPLNKNFNYWYVGIGLKFNIASLYKGGKSVKRAKYAAERTAEQAAFVGENISTEVTSSHVRFNESFTTYEMNLKSLQLANENYAVVENRYLNDLALITDMLDAANSKLSAELSVENARINILFNYYRLKRAVGNL